MSDRTYVKRPLNLPAEPLGSRGVPSLGKSSSWTQGMSQKRGGEGGGVRLMKKDSQVRKGIKGYEST